MKSVKGFTLIELMVTITVLAILISVVMPSFQRTAANNAVKSTARDFVATVNTARMQSMSMRSNIAISPLSGDWNEGWQLDFPIASAEEDQDFTPADSVTVTRTGGAGALTFLGRGGLQGGVAVFEVCHSDANVDGREISISFLGKVTSVLKECS